MSENALKPEPVSIRQSDTAPVNGRGIAMSEGFAETTDFLNQLIESGAGIYLLTGAQGIGKSTALRYSELHSTDNTVAIIHSFRRIDVDNLSELLGHTLGVKLPQNLPPEARALRYFLKLGTIRAKGKRLILMLDDVQELHSSGAELLKALVNMKDETGPLITVVLCGDTSLNAFLDKSYRWGIQRLIRKNHEMQGFSESELPALVGTLMGSSAETVIPLKSSALQTLFSLSGGNPGSVEKLLNGGTQIAAKHHYQAISSRILKGANSGEFKTLSQIATQYATKSVAAMALLLLVPITLFQQDIQQQPADRPPVERVETPVAAAPESAFEHAADTQESNIEQPVVAAVADDIALDRIATTVAVAPVEQPEPVTPTELPPQVQDEYAYSGFNQKILPADLVPPQLNNLTIQSYNQRIPADSENVLRLLKRFRLTIPASAESG